MHLFVRPQYWRASNYKLFFFFFLFIFVAQTSAQTSAAVESGKFRLHKFQQEIGEETYEIARTGDSLLVKSNFKFTDRGTPVSLTAFDAQGKYCAELWQSVGFKP